MKKTILFIGLALFGFCQEAFAQKDQGKQIDYTSERTLKNEEKYPGALIMYKVKNQVVFRHEGIKVWCDQAIFYQKDNFFRASGHVKMKQGDTITLTSSYAEYDGNTKFAFASNNVRLETPTTTLTTDSLFFDRKKQEAFYRSGGTVRDTASTITSKVGRYYLSQKKYSFLNNVVVTNPNYTIHSNHIDFYTENGHAFLYGPSTITGKESRVFCKRGFYDTRNDKGYFVKDAKVFYDHRKMEGDSIYFNRKTHFASASNNIKVTDTINHSVVYGHYAEVYRAKDSVFITKHALVAMKQGKDSIYIHSDTIMVTGKPEHRILRAYYDARIYKDSLSGRCDSIFMRKDKGITRLLGKPVFFSGLTQITGDTIELYTDEKTNKLDSISVFNHAFLNQKDTLGGFNQVKGKLMYGLFEDNELQMVKFIKNTESIYFWRNEKGKLNGIDKAISSSIKVTFENGEARFIEYDENPDRTIYQPVELPKPGRRLKGFIWRGEDRILSKAGLFEGEPPLHLPKIRGIPLPKTTNFFEDIKPEKGDLMNKKSRLSPEILQDHHQDSTTTKKVRLKNREMPQDSVPKKQ